MRELRESITSGESGAMNANRCSNGMVCEASEKIDEIHTRVAVIDDTLKGLVKELIDEIRQLNKSLMKAVFYIAIGLSGLWFVDHFGLDKAADFINKVKAEPR